MCRYAYHLYKRHFACFSCHKAFKTPRRFEALRPQEEDFSHRESVPCPECGMPMVNMGLDFKAPRQANVRQWRKVEILYRHRIAFHSCGCGPGPRPRTLADVPGFLAGTGTTVKRKKLLSGLQVGTETRGRQRRKNRS